MRFQTVDILYPYLSNTDKTIKMEAEKVEELLSMSKEQLIAMIQHKQHQQHQHQHQLISQGNLQSIHPQTT